MNNTKLIRGKWIVTVVALLTSGACLAAPAEKVTLASSAQVSAPGQDAQTLADQRAELEGDGFLDKGQYAAAIDTYQKLDLHQARIINKLGMAYEYLGGLNTAKSDFEQAIKLDPKLAVAYNNLATVYYAEHDNKKAEKFYKKAIKLDPRAASAYKNLGTCYFAMRKYGKGSEAYAVAMKIDPAILLGNKSLSVAQLDKDLLAETNYFLAELCAEHGQMSAALAYLDKAVSFGFHDARRLYNDRALASVREMPGFESLLRDGFTK